MCKNCYHSRGREKLADKCPHTDRANYAHGVCKNCYLSAYHRERRAQNKEFKANGGVLATVGQGGGRHKKLLQCTAKEVE